VANEEQKDVLELNFNLTQYELYGSDGEVIPLSEAQKTNYLLEKAKATQLSNPDLAKQSLNEFFLLTTDHPQMNEALLLKAELLLASNYEAERLRAKRYLERLAAQPNSFLESPRYLRATLKSALAHNSFKKVQSLMDLNKAGEIELQAAFLLYEKKEYAKAAEVFKALAESDSAELANYYTALCYLRLGTSAHIEDAVRRLEALKQSKEFSGSAKELLIDYYVSSGLPEEALKLLATMAQTMEYDLFRARSYILLGDQMSVTQAISLYQGIYENPSLSSLNRYRVAVTLSLLLKEHMMESDLMSLYSEIANFEKLPMPEENEEWQLFERLADNSITLFQKKNRWKDAHKLAKHLSAGDTPNAEKYKALASEIAQKYVLNDED